MYCVNPSNFWAGAVDWTVSAWDSAVHTTEVWAVVAWARTEASWAALSNIWM